MSEKILVGGTNPESLIPASLRSRLLRKPATGIVHTWSEGDLLPKYGDMIRNRGTGGMAMYVGRTGRSAESIIVGMKGLPHDIGYVTDKELLQFWELAPEA